MNAYVSVCRDGTTVVCPFTDGPRQIQFASDPPIPLPFHGLYVVAALQADGDHWAIMQGAEDNAPVLLVKRRDRSITQLRPSCGQQPVWVTSQGHLLMTLCTSWWRDGQELFFPPTSGVDGSTSQGFAWVDDDGTPHFMDHSPVGPNHPDGRRQIHGMTAIQLRKSGDWEVFLISSFNGVLVHRISTDEIFQAWEGYTPVAPNITEQLDGSAIVTVNLPGLFIHSSEFQPFTIPAPIFYSGPYSVAAYDDPQAPQLAVVGGPAVDNCFGVYTEIHANPTQNDPPAAVAQLAKQLNKPVFAYRDARPTQPLWDDLADYYVQQLVNSGAPVVVPTVQCYPVAGETKDQCQQRLLPAIDRARRKWGHLALTLGFYFQYNPVDGSRSWSIDELLQTVEVATTLGQSYRCEWYLPFVYTRDNGLDGIVSLPLLQATYQSLKNSALGAPPLLPQQPPIVTPVPPSVRPSSLELFMPFTTVSALKASRFFNHPDNDGSFAYRKANGKLLCINPSGGDDGDRDTAGAWEKFWYVKGEGFCTADRDGDNIYLLPVSPDR